ncbi:MAG TPA: outer membrane protein transport protein, partial [Nitrospirales bacterium]
FAGGFALNEMSAAATGKGTAFVGEANDPSAIFYNPAGITQLPGTQLMIGASLIKLDSTFRSSTTNETTQLQDQFPVLPHIFITHRFKRWDERLSIGFGIYTPFGIVIDWPDNYQGRFAPYDARLRLTVFNPTIAFQATRKLSIAAGLQVTYAGAGFEQKFAIPAFGIGESKARIHGLTAHPIGWNVGALYHITETTSAGIQFRSELQAKFNGDADFTGPAAALFTNTKFSSSIKLPPRIVAGVSTKIVPRWTINGEIEWQGWNTVGTIPKTFTTTADSPAAQSGLNDRGVRNWKNSWVYKVGAEFAATDRLALRGGYFYDESAIPDNTFTPTIPTSNLHALTVGFGYKWPTVVVDAAYLFGLYEKRSIGSTTIQPDNLLGLTTFGSYASRAQVAIVSVTFKF